PSDIWPRMPARPRAMRWTPWLTSSGSNHKLQNRQRRPLPSRDRKEAGCFSCKTPFPHFTVGPGNVMVLLGTTINRGGSDYSFSLSNLLDACAGVWYV